MGAKDWAGKTIIGLAIYMVMFVLIVTYADSMTAALGLDSQGQIIQDVDLEKNFGNEYSCGYPRFKYKTDGSTSQYVFDLDNLDCEVSAGALSEKTCDNIEGCTWGNETTGFLWFSTLTGVCEGKINKTAYNDGNATSDNLCKVEGLQGNENINACGALGCTVYEPKTQGDLSGVSSTADVVGTLGSLFTFRYDFGFERSISNFLANFLMFTLPLLVLGLCLYLLSPLSN